MQITFSATGCMLLFAINVLAVTVLGFSNYQPSYHYTSG